MGSVVAIVGRPNVGKSTLFNRLTGKRLAIVDDAPGVTRDRHYAFTSLLGKSLTLIDTGGFDIASDDPMDRGIARQVRVAIEEADIILCVFEASGPPTPGDRDAVELLRRTDKPVIYVANKADSDQRRLEASALYELGIEELVFLSALHGRGVENLLEVLSQVLPAEPAEEELASTGQLLRVALLGRPNAGKSSLFNRLAGAERSLVDAMPGTTRDPVDSLIQHKGQSFLLVDTAGVRRRPRVQRGIESASVIRSLRAIERAQVVVFLCDSTEGVSDQDQRLVALAAERGRAIVVGLNKMDLLSKTEQREAEEAAAHALRFALWAPRLPISAKSGRGVDRLVRHIMKCAAEFNRRIPTAELNRFFERVLERRPPGARGRRPARIFYVTQAQTAPPGFCGGEQCSS